MEREAQILEHVANMLRRGVPKEREVAEALLSALRVAAGEIERRMPRAKRAPRGAQPAPP